MCRARSGSRGRLSSASCMGQRPGPSGTPKDMDVHHRTETMWIPTVVGMQFLLFYTCSSAKLAVGSLVRLVLVVALSSFSYGCGHDFLWEGHMSWSHVLGTLWTTTTHWRLGLWFSTIRSTITKAESFQQLLGKSLLTDQAALFP